jgi:hypothetical protein
MPPAVDFFPASSGCPMAHCAPTMSDRVRRPAPTRVRSSWLDSSAASGQQGLGCSSNGKIAVCTFGDRSRDSSRPYLKAYEPTTGRVLWTSGKSLDAWAWTSAAIVDAKGGAIAAVDRALVRFAPGGTVRWSSRTPGGSPISPTQVANGTIVLATSGGPVSAYEPRTGRRIATLDLKGTIGGRAGRFDTTNTPGARGNRIYVSTQFELADGSADPGFHARLFAIDVDPSKPAARRLHVAWSYEFGARSGASPLVVGDLVVFDGDRATPTGPVAPRFFGLRDAGRRPKLAWSYPLGGPGVASAAQDPRGGAWVFAFGNPTLRRISLASGKVVQTIDLDKLVGADGTHVPYSAMSIAEGPGGHPAMIVTARAGLLSTYVVAVDLVTERPLWTYRVPGSVFDNTPEGQFPVAGKAVVTSMRGGIRGIVGG